VYSVPELWTGQLRGYRRSTKFERQIDPLWYFGGLVASQHALDFEFNPCKEQNRKDMMTALPVRVSMPFLICPRPVLYLLVHTRRLDQRRMAGCQHLE